MKEETKVELKYKSRKNMDQLGNQDIIDLYTFIMGMPRSIFIVE